MGLDTAKDLQYEETEKETLSQTPRNKNVIDFDKERSALSEQDIQRINRGEASLTDIKRESTQIKDTAGKLLQIALKQGKVSEDEVEEIEKQLDESTEKTAREGILKTIQKKISTIDTSEDKDKVLDKNSPALRQAYNNYDKLITEHEDVLGIKAAQKYKQWIREQNPTINTIEDLTSKFFQTELPERLKIWNQLKKTLAKYGVNNPLDIPLIEGEGRTARRNFLENIERAEKVFDTMGDKEEAMYDPEAKKEVMHEVCTAKNKAEQDKLVGDMENLSKEESEGYTTLSSAISYSFAKHKISQKSMDNMLDYYKTLRTVDKRRDNLRMWESFISNESKLKDELGEIFEANDSKNIPKNEDGLRLAFQVFKDLDYVGKENFIKEQRRKREHAIDQELENRELTISAFNHECAKARQKGDISRGTEKNYKAWMDKNSKGKTYKELKEFLDVLTSPEPSEEYKNLAAYKRRRESFKQTLREVGKNLTPKEIKEKEKEYDEEGWTKRDELHKELKETYKNPEKKEEKETNVDREVAMEAINDLIKLKAYGTAQRRCTKLLAANPNDKELSALLERIIDLADSGVAKTEKKPNEKEYEDLAEKMLTEDTQVKEDSDEVQTYEQALILTRRDQQQRKQMSAKERNREEITDGISHDEELTGIANAYIDEGDDEKVIDKDTLKAKDVLEFDFDSGEDTREEKKSQRKAIQQEMEKAGEHKGSSVIDFKATKTNRTLDAESGKEADREHEGEKEELAKEMAEDLVKMTDPEGKATPEKLILAREAALAKLNKKAKTRIERMAG